MSHLAPYREKTSPVNIPALTGLRFFAAFAIVLWHSQGDIFFQLGAFNPFYPAGAVPLFFVLSGFVLTINAVKYPTWSDFFAARIARIWPAHLATLVLFIVLAPHGKDVFRTLDGASTLALNVLLLHAWVPRQEVYWSFNSPSWSVSSEMVFYAVFPLCLALLSRRPWLRLVALVGVVVSLIALAAHVLPGLDANWLGAVNPLAGFGSFAIGIVFGLVSRQLP